MGSIPSPERKPASVWPIHHMADAAETRIVTAFRLIWLDIRAVLASQDIALAYELHNPDRLWETASWHAAMALLYRRIRHVLEREVVTVGTAALRALPVIRKADLSDPRTAGAFRVLNDEAIAWAGDHTGQLVQGIDGESRRAIRAIITQMLRGRLGPSEAVREIRNLVGLTETQAHAVYNFRRKLEAKAGLLEDRRAAAAALTPQQRLLLGNRLANTQARIDRLVDRYERRMFRYRAEMIARTESMTAANRGLQAAWRAAQATGLLPLDAVQQWLVTPDGRLCPLCQPMENQTAPLGQRFVNPNTGTSYVSPPIHPNCRCAVSIVIPETPLTPEEQLLAEDIQVTITRT